MYDRIGRKPYLGTVFVILVFSGCQSSSEVAEVSPERDLRRRAEAYTAACVAEDWKTLYTFYTPEYREEKPETAFIEDNEKNGLFRFNAYVVREVEVQDDFGWVKADCETRLTKFPDTPPRKTSAWDKWRRQDGVWYPCSAEEGKLLPLPPSMRDADGERALEDRFWAFEAALEADDHKAIQEFLPPESRLSDEELMGESKTIPVGCDLQWVEVAGDRGRIHVEYLVKLNDPHLTKLEPKRVAMTEIWINLDGQWYRDVGP